MRGSNDFKVMEFSEDGVCKNATSDTIQTKDVGDLLQSAFDDEVMVDKGISKRSIAELGGGVMLAAGGMRGGQKIEENKWKKRGMDSKFHGEVDNIENQLKRQGVARSTPKHSAEIARRRMARGESLSDVGIARFSKPNSEPETKGYISLSDSMIVTKEPEVKSVDEGMIIEKGKLADVGHTIIGATQTLGRRIGNVFTGATDNALRDTKATAKEAANSAEDTIGRLRDDHHQATMESWKNKRQSRRRLRAMKRQHQALQEAKDQRDDVNAKLGKTLVAGAAAIPVTGAGMYGAYKLGQKKEPETKGYTGEDISQAFDD